MGSVNKTIITATTGADESEAFNAVGNQTVTAGALAPDETITLQQTFDGSTWQNVIINGITQAITPTHTFLTIPGSGLFKCVKSSTAGSVAVVLWDAASVTPHAGPKGATAQTNGGIPVNVQDKTTGIVIVPLNQVSNETTNTVETAADDYTITLTATTGFVDGVLVGIYASSGALWFGRQVGAPAGSVITVDRPITGIFAIGSDVVSSTTNMNVDGSGTTQIFSLKQKTSPLPISLDISRIIITIYSDTAADLSKFGDLAALTNGCTLRRVDDTDAIIFNVKDNGEIAGLCYDLDFYTALGQGQDGLAARITFASPGKMGAVVQLAQDEDLQLLINDDLTDLVKFEIVAEGSVART